MKRTLIGGFFLLGGCVIFSACMICASFEGVVPSDVNGERWLAILLMIIGIAVIIREAWCEKSK